MWIDDETGYKLIEQYQGDSHALLCKKCKFRTLKAYREELIKAPADTASGKVIRPYKCSYCETLEAIVAPLDND